MSDGAGDDLTEEQKENIDELLEETDREDCVPLEEDEE